MSTMTNRNSFISLFLFSLFLIKSLAQQAVHNVSDRQNAVFSCGQCVCEKLSSKDVEFENDIAINCSAGGVRTVSSIKFTFHNGSRIVSIDLSYNPKLFAHLSANKTKERICQIHPDLQSLSIAFNDLKDLPLFIKGCRKLQVLSLSGNNLASLHAGDLDDLRGLVKLHGLTVGYLQTGAFQQLSRLEELTLTFVGGRLRRIFFSGNFRNFTLYGPKVRKLPPRFWSGFHNLTSLDLWLPQLNKLDGTLPAEIQTLSLRGIKSLKPNQLSHLTDLNTLKIAESQQIDNLLLPRTDKIRVFEIHTCLLSKLPQQWKGSLENVETLCLRRNKLNDVRTNLPNLSKLRYLDLSHNYISELEPGSLAGFNRLETINMSNNDLEKMRPGVLSTLPNLTTAIFSQNYLDEWRPGRMRSLRYLDLSTNYLRDLNLSTPRLMVLDVSENELESFPTSLYSLNISVVRMRGNDLLNTISGKELCGISSLSFVDLSGAQLSCNCDVRALGMCNQRIEVIGLCGQHKQNLSSLRPCVVSTTSAAPNTTETTLPIRQLVNEARILKTSPPPIHPRADVRTESRNEPQDGTENKHRTTTTQRVRLLDDSKSDSLRPLKSVSKNQPSEDDSLKPTTIVAAIMGTACICFVIVIILVAVGVWWRVKGRWRRHGEPTQLINLDRNISNTAFRESLPLMHTKLDKSLKARDQIARSIDYITFIGHRNILDIMHVASVPSSSSVGRKPLVTRNKDSPTMSHSCEKSHDIGAQETTPSATDVNHGETFSGLGSGLGITDTLRGTTPSATDVNHGATVSGLYKGSDIQTGCHAYVPVTNDTMPDEKSENNVSVDHARLCVSVESSQSLATELTSRTAALVDTAQIVDDTYRAEAAGSDGRPSPSQSHRTFPFHEQEDEVEY